MPELRELVYADLSAWKEIEEAFPGKFKYQDASDMIHEDRFEITGDVPEDEFYPWAIKTGLSQVCLCFQLMMHDKKGCEKIRGWLDKLKAEKENQGDVAQ